MLASKRFAKNKYLLKIRVGDPEDQKEVFNESVQEVFAAVVLRSHLKTG
jgi:hypothetical protein